MYNIHIYKLICLSCKTHAKGWKSLTDFHWHGCHVCHADVTFPHFHSSWAINVTIRLSLFLSLLKWHDATIVYLCCCVLSVSQRFDRSCLAPLRACSRQAGRQAGTEGQWLNFNVSLSVWYLIRRLPHDPSHWFIFSQEMHLHWARSSVRTDTVHVATLHQKKWVFPNLPAELSTKPGNILVTGVFFLKSQNDDSHLADGKKPCIISL